MVYNKYGGRCSQTRAGLTRQFSLGFRAGKGSQHFSLPTAGKPNHGPVIQ